MIHHANRVVNIGQIDGEDGALILVNSSRLVNQQMTSPIRSVGSLQKGGRRLLLQSGRVLVIRSQLLPGRNQRHLAVARPATRSLSGQQDLSARLFHHRNRNILLLGQGSLMELQLGLLLCHHRHWLGR